MGQGLRCQGVKASVQGLDLPDNGHWGRGCLGGQERRGRDSLCPLQVSVDPCQSEGGTKWPIKGYDHCRTSLSFFKI